MSKLFLVSILDKCIMSRRHIHTIANMILMTRETIFPLLRDRGNKL